MAIGNKERTTRARLESRIASDVLWGIAFLILLGLIGNEHYKAACAYGLVLALILFTRSSESTKPRT